MRFNNSKNNVNNNLNRTKQSLVANELNEIYFLNN